MTSFSARQPIMPSIVTEFALEASSLSSAQILTILSDRHDPMIVMSVAGSLIPGDHSLCQLWSHLGESREPCNAGQADHAPPPVVQLMGRGPPQRGRSRGGGHGQHPVLSEEAGLMASVGDLLSHTQFEIAYHELAFSLDMHGIE